MDHRLITHIYKSDVLEDLELNKTMKMLLNKQGSLVLFKFFNNKEMKKKCTRIGTRTNFYYFKTGEKKILEKELAEDQDTLMQSLREKIEESIRSKPYTNKVHKYTTKKILEKFGLYEVTPVVFMMGLGITIEMYIEKDEGEIGTNRDIKSVE